MCHSNLLAKKFVNMANLARQFWKNFGTTPANCSEIYAIS